MYALWYILNFTVKDNEWFPIFLNNPNAETIVIQCRSNTDVLVRSGLTPNYFTLKGGGSWIADVKGLHDPILRVQSAKGDIILEVIVYEYQS